MQTIGILAHVDAGKTTLSEAILYETGAIRETGRVDNKDTVMDTHELEKQRGITIFSNRAAFCVRTNADEKRYILLDTPGHADFSAETERCLNVLDYAVLIISSPEGVQSHAVTLWKLLKKYGIPTFIFVNKTDMCMKNAGVGELDDATRTRIIANIREKLDGECAEITDLDTIAMCDEDMMNEYLSSGEIEHEKITRAIAERKLFPISFGSALRGEGVKEFLSTFAKYTEDNTYTSSGSNAQANSAGIVHDSNTRAGEQNSDEFKARVYKITHDDKHNRLTHMKILSGTIAIRDKIGSDKVNGIFMDADNRGNTDGEVQKAYAGDIVTVSGLSATYPGQGIGCDDAPVPEIEPVMTYKVTIENGVSPVIAMDCLKEIEEENPELKFIWDEKNKEIKVSVMGIIQLEVLHELARDRYNLELSFGAGSIVYKETIANVVEGVGHFEPLRHYAEVHLLMEPGERGSGVVAASDVSTDELALNWQRLIVTHILERTHSGVLTGSELTDVKITVKAGRAHIKHTEGGDFRQATYRAIRQGLMQAESVLLEPYYDFLIELPAENLGKAMIDIENMQGKCEPPIQETDRVVLKGYAPVSCLWNYQNELKAYTGGYGSISLSLRGYDVCHNTEEVLAANYYDPDLDLRNPSGSVFCERGSGVVVPWNEVKNYMHVESIFALHRDDAGIPLSAVRTPKVDEWLDLEEVDAIIKKMSGANAKSKAPREPKKVQNFGSSVTHVKPHVVKPKYLLIDGYNIIFAWPELKNLAASNIDSARLKLNDIISNYAGFCGIETAVVYDAYRVQNHKTEISEYHNIHIVYTATAETADHYIEQFTHQNASKYEITVATSDGVEQIIIRSQGCILMSAMSLYEEVKRVNEEIKEIIDKNGSV